MLTQGHGAGDGGGGSALALRKNLEPGGRKAEFPSEL